MDKLSDLAPNSMEEPSTRPNDDDDDEQTISRSYNNASDELNDLIKQIMHLINNKKSMPDICCEKRMKCCRPKAIEFMHYLKRSLFLSNDKYLENEKLLQLSQKLIEDNITEWSKRICGCLLKRELKHEGLQINSTLSFEKMPNAIERINGASNPVQHVNILIIGAGLGGLGAATSITQSKQNFTYLILEAQSEAGGRVKTINDFHQIDAGAQWLHGRFNYLYKFAENFNLLTSDQSEEGLGVFLYENGMEIDEFFVKKIDFQIGKLLNECEQFVKINLNTYPTSVGHFLCERFKCYLNCFDNVMEKNCANDIFDWHKRFQIIDNSCLSLNHLSAKYWGKYSFNGESSQAHYNFKMGFKSLIDHLINDLNPNCIEYNKHVIEIQIHNNQIESNDKQQQPQQQQKNISVKCTDGSFYTADHVLVTLPLGILKMDHQQLFKPNLPIQMRMAIDSLGYETINKIFLEFDTRWWNHMDGIQFIYHCKPDDDDDEEEEKHWTRYLTGFDVMKSNILLGWVGGRGAIQMEQMNDQDIIDDCVQILKRFTNIDVPQPKRYYCTRWHSNPFIKGAYSYISTDCDNNDTISANRLSQKMTIHDFYPNTDSTNDDDDDVPLVLFAGEACHNKYFSTAHGAFLSGMEQANKFMN